MNYPEYARFLMWRYVFDFGWYATLYLYGTDACFIGLYWLKLGNF